MFTLFNNYSIISNKLLKKKPQMHWRLKSYYLMQKMLTGEKNW